MCSKRVVMWFVMACFALIAPVSTQAEEMEMTLEGTVASKTDDQGATTYWLIMEQGKTQLPAAEGDNNPAKFVDQQVIVVAMGSKEELDGKTKITISKLISIKVKE